MWILYENFKFTSFISRQVGTIACVINHWVWDEHADILSIYTKSLLYLLQWKQFKNKWTLWVSDRWALIVFIMYPLNNNLVRCKWLQWRNLKNICSFFFFLKKNYAMLHVEEFLFFTGYFHLAVLVDKYLPIIWFSSVLNH